MQYCIKLFKIWISKNRLTIDSDETKYMVFFNREHEIDDSFLSVDQNSPHSVKYYKFLGVLIDDKQSF